MAVEIGKFYEGKVSGITKFGAFVELEDGTNGLVHISEVSNLFVSDINDILKVGDKVKVKVIKVNDDGKISMSIKQAENRLKKGYGKGFNERMSQDGRSGGNQFKQRQSAPNLEISEDVVYSDGFVQKTSGDANFEDMLSKFKALSEEKMSVLKKAGDNRRSRSRRK